MRKLIFIVAVVACALTGAPAWAQCSGGGFIGNMQDHVSNGGFNGGTCWTISGSGTTSHSGQYMCTSWSTFLKADGSSGFGEAKQSFTTNNNFSTFELKYTIEFSGFQNSANNRVYYLVRNVTDSGSWETLDEVTGASGDRYCETRTVSVTRTDWKGKTLEIIVGGTFFHSGAVAKISAVGFHQRFF